MKKHLLTFLATVLSMVTTQQGRAQQSMVAVHDESGRMVWVNDEDPKPKPLSQPTIKPSYRNLIYWSQAEHRWKPVPRPSPAMMKGHQVTCDDIACPI